MNVRDAKVFVYHLPRDQRETSLSRYGGQRRECIHDQKEYPRGPLLERRVHSRGVSCIDNVNAGLGLFEQLRDMTSGGS